jgi:hypothetical protein
VFSFGYGGKSVLTSARISPRQALSPPAIRTHEVRSPTARAETWAVARAVFHILYWTALIISAEAHAARRPEAAAAGRGEAPAFPSASPFERRFQDLPPADQRLFRALQEGVVEAERVRSTTGRWPGVEDLARAGVPPFARDPLDVAGFAWQLVQTGAKVDYIGTPRAGSGREAFFAVIVEPDPGDPVDPLAPVDETHHRLADGRIVHVTVWTGPPLADTGAAFSLLPPEAGYRQVLAAR